MSVVLIDHDSRVSFLGRSVRTDNGFKSCCYNGFLVSLFHVSLPCPLVNSCKSRLTPCLLKWPLIIAAVIDVDITNAALFCSKSKHVFLKINSTVEHPVATTSLQQPGFQNTKIFQVKSLTWKPLVTTALRAKNLKFSSFVFNLP